MKMIHLCPTKIKLTSLGMYTSRENDYCAGSDFVMKDGNKLKLTSSRDPAHDGLLHEQKQLHRNIPT